MPKYAKKNGDSKKKMKGADAYVDMNKAKIKGYYNEPMSKDWQSSPNQSAGMFHSSANEYMERKDSQMNSEAAKIRSQEYKGRYD